MSNTDLESFFGNNAAFIEELYERYTQNPALVDASWQQIFNEAGSPSEVLKGIKGASWFDKSNRVIVPEPVNDNKGDATVAAGENSATADSIRAMLLIRGFRERGHTEANIDPLQLKEQKLHPELQPESYGFTADDYNKEIFLGGELGLEKATLSQLLATLRQTYCSNIGFECEYIEHPEQKEWIRSYVENTRGTPNFSADEKREILNDLTEAELFEQFIHIKFIGAKRFSLEGGDATIPAIRQIVETSSDNGVNEVVLGMPHRGRLNVITNIMKEPYKEMFSKFHGTPGMPDFLEVSGDVKYHMGGSHDATYKNGKTVHLSLTPNPSHLEAVNTVVQGKVRAKQDNKQDVSRQNVMGILLHGDAAFAGQGSVAEGLLLSHIDGYTTGGIVHIIVNNQVGFTTNPELGRAGDYPTDVAKMVEAPILHVNGDDPEACVYVAKLAAEFRAKFKKDVVIDLVCYRRYGHNESDEPMFTQPVMYSKIKTHATPRKIYADRLVGDNVLTQADVDTKVNLFKDELTKAFDEGKSFKPQEADWLEGSWKGLKASDKPNNNPKTGIDIKTLKQVGEGLTNVPDGFNINKKVLNGLKAKQQMFEKGAGIDWATGEALAFGSLLLEGKNVRLSGQDCERGTFSHRHSVFNDQKTREKYTPLNNLGAGEQANYEVINSALSEFGVLGFEYGYASADPHALVCWEAQFGDFSNGAQVIIDQFISSGESKWLRMNGVVMLLPHGYEGQGPEHSSARLERYLQLCAENNMQVANCTTPANYFHVLRRQLAREYRKPLIVMTPKSLLRHKLAVSELKEFDKNTTFKPVISDDLPTKGIKRVVLCSGKVYYDLWEARKEQNIKDVAIIRVEQLYPFPAEELAAELKQYKDAQVIWCQEEPQNNGAWQHVDRCIENVLLDIKAKHTRPQYVGRKASASPATGYLSIHNKEQAELVNKALKV